MIEVVGSNAVFLGDNVLNGRIPRIDNGSIPGNITACNKILESGAMYYVPGHGKSGGPEIVTAMRNYYDILYTAVQSLYEEGLNDFEMKDAISGRLQAYSGWEDFDLQLGKHINFAYLQIESETF